MNDEDDLLYELEILADAAYPGDTWTNHSLKEIAARALVEIKRLRQEVSYLRADIAERN